MAKDKGPVRMDAAEIEAFLAESFPQIVREVAVVSVGENRALVRLETAERHLRPGGTVSGPTLFMLADVAFYIALLAMIGPVALAVTTNCAIDFMRKPQAGQALLAEVQILKLGRVLAVGDVLIRPETGPPVARASLTYSIPPRAEG